MGSGLDRRAGLNVLAWAGLDGAGVAAFVTTRHGGVSDGPYRSLNLGLHVGDADAAVVENRRRAAAALGLTLDQLVFCNQTHGRRVSVVGRADGGRGARSRTGALDDCDALVTAEAGVGLVMMAADCTPLVLADPAAGVVACVHSGWRGTVARVSEAAVAAMVGLGAAPERILVGVGPTVAADGYQVGPEVAAAVTDTFGDRAEDLLRPDDDGRWRFDLQAANLAVLADAGIDPRRVEATALASGDEPFFSDRRVRPCGRMAAMVALAG